MKNIFILKKKLDENNLLKYEATTGETVEVEFKWNEPVSYEDILKFEKETNIILPEEYKKFLTISNGATFYEDPVYGGSGTKIFGLEEILKETKDRISWGYELKDSWIVFAELLEGCDFLLFDTEKYKTKKYIIDGDTGYSVEEWKFVKCDFGTWLDRLIMVNGETFWRWC